MPWHSSFQGSNLALILALKGGTVYELLSELTSELQKVKVKNFRVILKKTCFQVWPFVIPVPVEIRIHTVPHFKATINAKLQPKRLECSVTYLYLLEVRPKLRFYLRT